MENIDYEKAYKAVLQTATQWIKDGCTDKEKICLESVFPELRESEDERIRKELIGYHKHMAEMFVNDESCRHPVWLAWLEKQKNLEGDFARGYDSGYEACLHSHGAEWFEKQKEQKKDNPLEDFSRGYNAGYYHGITDSKQKPAEWNDTDMKEARNNLISVCRDWECGKQTTLLPIAAVRARYFLEHLTEPKPSWKPSEEHLSALLAIFNDPDNIGSQTCQLALTDLYEQLKKL